MRLPPDHPIVGDPALAAWRAGVDELCADMRLGPTLRYLPGRRIAVRVESGAGPAVLKVFARPRARGNDRRLRLLARSPAGFLVPRALGADASGHVGLVEWVDGEVMEALPGDRVVAAAHAVGGVLRALHESGVTLDREWVVENELRQLRRRAVPATTDLVDAVVDDPATIALVDAPLVSAHRDFHPRQVVVDGDVVRLIDLDDAAQAPAALDVGNFLAHLTRDVAVGRLSPVLLTPSRRAFREGYGATDGSEDAWERLALVRLAGLATSRHGRADWSARLRTLCAR